MFKKSCLILSVLICLSGCDQYQALQMPSNVVNNQTLVVDACDLRGQRQANVKVDIGYDSDKIVRNYWGYTNNYGQLVYIHADQLILQQKSEEHYKHRLCKDEADVAGTKAKNYDQGHVIADALGGVSNAYNITPENSYVNRAGHQYQLEQKWIDLLYNHQQVTNVNVIIDYPNQQTQIPTKYHFSWEVNGIGHNLTFANKE